MKRILLGVSGLNPQVITETLYALFMQGRMVEEIHIITTKVGYEHLLKFIAPSGPLEQFLKEYNIPQDSIKFPVENIHVVKDEFGSDCG